MSSLVECTVEHKSAQLPNSLIRIIYLYTLYKIHTPDSSRYWLAGSYEERFQKGLEPENVDKVSDFSCFCSQPIQLKAGFIGLETLFIACSLFCFIQTGVPKIVVQRELQSVRGRGMHTSSQCNF